MKIREILSKYVNDKDREREIGHYYASEVGQIIKGYLKPKDFFKHREIDECGVKNICSGQAFEAELKRAFEKTKTKYQHEPRKEIHLKDFFIVVKPDFILGDKIIECKFPVRTATPEEYLERYKYQLELEYRAFKKKVYLGIFSHPFDIKTYKYQESEKTWEEIVEALTNFHKELCKNK